MKEILNTETIKITISIVVALSACLVALLSYIKYKSNLSRMTRYDSERKVVELEYMRKNLEMQLYDISKKLEENESRWRDINHLIITSQNKYEERNYNKSDIPQSTLLKTLGIDNQDLEINSRQIFVLTPFNPDYYETFLTVKKVSEKLRFQCIRGDEEFIPNEIFPTILKQIVKSRLIIANITGRNPNVMYELGVAHALGKPTIIISKNFTEIPFDLNNKRIIIYNDENNLAIQLENSISDMLINRAV